MKYRLIMAALLLSWPALAQETVAPADVPAAIPAPEVSLPSVEVAPPTVETPIVDMTSPVVAPDIPMDIPAPDIGASVATPDVGMPPVIETPAMAPAPEIALPSMEVASPTVEPPATDMSSPALAPATEPLSIDMGLKSAGPQEYSGGGGHDGPEASQPEVTIIDTTAIGKGGDAHAEGGDATSILKNENDISNLNINEGGDVENTNTFKPELENTNIVKPVQEVTVNNEDKNVNNNSDYTKIDNDNSSYTKVDVDVNNKTITNVEVNPVVKLTVQNATATAQKSSMSEWAMPLAIVGAAVVLSKRGDDRGCGDDCGRRARKRYYARRAELPNLKGPKPGYGGNACQEGERYDPPHCVPTH
jgi:hypothetical protein